MAAGGKIAHFDRVELIHIPDTATAIDALIAGEIDWVEEVPADMLAFFDGQNDAMPIAARQSGNSMQLVVNHLNPPFDNPDIRHALQLALEQTPFLQAAFGNNTERFLECAAVFFAMDLTRRMPTPSACWSAIWKKPLLYWSAAAMTVRRFS